MKATIRAAVLIFLALVLSCGSGDRTNRESSTVTLLFESNGYVFGPSQDDTPKFLIFLSLISDTNLEGRLAER